MKILIIEDDMEIVEFVKSNFITHSHNVDTAYTGADDYMTKPFFIEELNARIRALTRRPKKIESSLLASGDLILDIKKQEVKRGEVRIYLTKTEYNILEFLLKNKGMIVSRGMIMEYVWNKENDPFSNTVEAHMAHLRKKIGINDNVD